MLARRRPAGSLAGPAADAEGTGHANDWGATWLADVGVLLPGDLDRDGDGFFAGFELTLDVDTETSAREVYAVIELTDTRGFVTLRHDSAVFTVHGYSSADRYRLEVELLSDHESGYRDLAVDIRDAYDGRLLDRASPHEFRSLAALPLEAEHDRFDDDPYHRDDVHHGENAYVAGYAAAGGPLALLPLLALALWRRSARGARIPPP